MQIVEVEPAAKGSRIAPFAATLSLLLPGLGQAALGRRRRGFLLAIPAIAIAVAAVAVAVSIADDPTAALDLVPGPEILPALLVLEIGLLAWHLVAIIDAEHLARAAHPVRGWRRVPAALVARCAAARGRRCARHDRIPRSPGGRGDRDHLRARRR